MPAADDKWTLRKVGSDRDYRTTFGKLKAWALEGRVEPDDLVGPAEQGSAGLTPARDRLELLPFLEPAGVTGAVLASDDVVAFGPRRGGGEDDEVILDMTPLIDCVFLLLIFFMLTATFSNQGGLRVKLPESGAAESEVDDKRLTVTVDLDGRYYLNDETEPTAKASLRTRLEKEVAASMRTTLIIRADEDVPHGAVVHVMDAGKRVGVEKILVGTEKKR